jgi:hypothetical protein
MTSALHRCFELLWAEGWADHNSDFATSPDERPRSGLGSSAITVSSEVEVLGSAVGR